MNKEPSNLLFFSWLIAACLAACGDDESEAAPPLFELSTVESDFEEVVPCKHSHEHELRHVRIFADPDSAEIFERCVLNAETEPCPEEAFPEGALFVKYEYEHEGCKANDLVSYTATLKLEPNSYPEGRDWHWQRSTTDLKVVEDGAPKKCLSCHENHCDPPHGFDLRCLPD